MLPTRRNASSGWLYGPWNWARCSAVSEEDWPDRVTTPATSNTAAYRHVRIRTSNRLADCNPHRLRRHINRRMPLLRSELPAVVKVDRNMEPGTPSAGLDEGHRLQDLQREFAKQPAPREATGRSIEKMADVNTPMHQVLVETLLRDAESIGDLRWQYMAAHRIDEPLEGRDHVRLHHVPQRGRHRTSLGRWLCLPPEDALAEHVGVRHRGRNQIVNDAEKRCDRLPGLQVGLLLLQRQFDLQLFESAQNDHREGDQRQGEILLVDRHAVLLGPRMRHVVEEPMSNRGVHQAHLLRRPTPAPAGIQATRRHYVDHHLRGLCDPAQGAAGEIARAIDHLHAL